MNNTYKELEETLNFEKGLFVELKENENNKKYIKIFNEEDCFILNKEKVITKESDKVLKSNKGFEKNNVKEVELLILNGEEFKNGIGDIQKINIEDMEKTLLFFGLEGISDYSNYKKEDIILLLKSDKEIISIAKIVDSKNFKNIKNRKELSIILTNKNHKNEGFGSRLISEITKFLIENKFSIERTRPLKEGEKYIKNKISKKFEDNDIKYFNNEEASFIYQNLYSKYYDRMNEEDYFYLEDKIIENFRLNMEKEDILYDLKEELEFIDLKEINNKKRNRRNYNN